MRMKPHALILLALLMVLVLILPIALSHAKRAAENEELRMISPARLMFAPLSNFTVMNLNDSGFGSLRQAIVDANANPGADVITFSVTGTITLTTGQLLITDALTITGPGDTNLAVSGNNTFRVFEIASDITVTISGLTIMNGKAIGGAIRNDNGTVTVTNSTLSNNSGSDAGGITNDGSGRLTIINSTLSNNSSPGSGGGIRNNGGTVLIINSTLSANSSRNGGGIANNGGTVTISNSTLSDNSSINGTGGAIVVDSGTANITNSTLVGNSAINNGGGGIRNFGVVNIKNSILANPSGGDCSSLGTVNVFGVVFSTVPEQGFSPCSGFMQVTATQINLGPLSNNDGPTQTHALLSGSVAIDAVSDCTDLGSNPVTTDQREVMRPLDGNGDGVSRCDAGAYEAPPIVSFDLCIQDDSKGSIFKINAATGDYQFTSCSGFTLSGTGRLIVKGGFITLQHYASDRRIAAKIDSSVKKGTASIQVFGQGTTFTVIDRNTMNNTCACTAQ